MSDEKLDLVLKKLDNMATKQDLQAINKKLDTIQADIQILKGGQKGIRAEITDKTAEVKTAIQGLSSDIEYTFHKTAQNELELKRLKNR